MRLAWASLLALRAFLRPSRSSFISARSVSLSELANVPPCDDQCVAQLVVRAFEIGRHVSKVASRLNCLIGHKSPILANLSARL
jgi:hypothetical protein